MQTNATMQTMPNSNVPVPAVLLQLSWRTHQGMETIIPIHQDGFLIGSGPGCDLRLAQSGLLTEHAVIHGQHGAVWIQQAAEDAPLMVNGAPCRRLALRHGDRISLCGIELSVLVPTESQAALEATAPLWQPPIATGESPALSTLSAAELVDLIESEQAEIAEFERAQQHGWRALLATVRELAGEMRPELPAIAQTNPRLSLVGPELDHESPSPTEALPLEQKLPAIAAPPTQEELDDQSWRASA